MNAFLFRALLVLLALSNMGAPSRALAITYTATLLNPPELGGSEGRGISGSTQVGYAGGDVTDGATHAVMWSSTASSWVDLHPSGFYVSYALGASGVSQVGYGSQPLKGYHALLWKGSATNFVDLDPGTFPGGTYAIGASETTQVGYGLTGASSPLPLSRALLWHGTPESVIDLTPPLYSDGMAYDSSETNQVGWSAGIASGNRYHALLWSGTAASAVDLHPAGFDESEAFGVWGTSQVGAGNPSTGGERHALLWNGSASSVIDLNPAGYVFSEARAVSAAGQVGFGSDDPLAAQHALVWNGSAESAVNLHPFLNTLGLDFFASNAWGISDDGTIVGTAFLATGGTYAVLWTPIPEPCTWQILACTAVAAIIRTRRRISLARPVAARKSREPRLTAAVNGNAFPSHGSQLTGQSFLQ